MIWRRASRPTDSAMTRIASCGSMKQRAIVISLEAARGRLMRGNVGMASDGTGGVCARTPARCGEASRSRHRARVRRHDPRPQGPSNPNSPAPGDDPAVAGAEVAGDRPTGADVGAGAEPADEAIAVGVAAPGAAALRASTGS